MLDDDIVMSDGSNKLLIENSPHLEHFVPVAKSLIKTLKTKNINDLTPSQLTLYVKLTKFLIINQIYDW